MVVMKKAVSFILFTALAVSCLSGCGGEFTDGTGKPGGAVSGGAVSDEPVSEETASGGAVKEEAGEDVQAGGRLGLYCSRNCGYFFRDDTSEELVQVSLKDGKKKVYKMRNMFDLTYVGEDELIYWVDEGKGATLYTAPIVSGPDGTEEVKPDEAKQVPGVPDKLDYIGAVYVDEQYIIYSRVGKVEVRCYNRKTGETSEMPMPGKIKGMVGDKITSVEKAIGERLYLWTAGSDVLCWQMDENRVYSYAGEEGCMFVDAYTNDGVFCIEASQDAVSINESSQDAVFIDVIGQKKAKIISKAEVDRLLAQEFGDVRSCSMLELFLDGSRVYAQVYIEWVENKTCYAHQAILSRESDGSGELKYERKLTEELVAAEQKAGGVEEGSIKKSYTDFRLLIDDISGVEKVRYYDGNCMIADGKAYLAAGDGEKTSACYDLKSGACKEINKGDWEYYAADILTGEEYF